MKAKFLIAYLASCWSLDKPSPWPFVAACRLSHTRPEEISGHQARRAVQELRPSATRSDVSGTQVINFGLWNLFCMTARNSLALR